MCVCAGLGFWSSAQNLTAVDVTQEIDYGGVHLYIMTDGASSLNYKSSASHVDVLDVGDEVQLDLTVTSGDYPMYIDGSISSLIAREISSSNSNSGFTLTNEIMYNLPYQDGDILFFENTQHIIDLTELLYNQEDLDINNNPSLEDSSIVFAFENEFPNFTSFREGITIKFADQEADGYDNDDMDAYYEYDHIHDDALKSFFNKYRLIGIGDSVYYYHNTNQIAHCHKDSLNSVERLRFAGSSLKEDSVFYNVDLVIDPNIQYTESKFDVIKTKDNIFVTTSTFDYVYSSRAYADVVNTNCNILTQGFRYEILRDEIGYLDGTGNFINGAGLEVLPLSFYNNTLQINWDDGSPIQTIDNYDGSFIQHTFPYEGEFDAVVTFTIYDPLIGQTIPFNDNSTTTELYFNTIGECTTDDDTEHTYNELGQWRLSSRVWVNENILGKHVGSYSHAWKYKNNKWRRRKATITTTVDGNFYNNQCQFAENKNGAKTQDSRRVQKVKSKVFAKRRKFTAVNGGVTSTHKLISGNTVISENLILNPCP